MSEPDTNPVPIPVRAAVWPRPWRLLGLLSTLARSLRSEVPVREQGAAFLPKAPTYDLDFAWPDPAPAAEPTVAEEHATEAVGAGKDSRSTVHESRAAAASWGLPIPEPAATDREDAGAGETGHGAASHASAAHEPARAELADDDWAWGP